MVEKIKLGGALALVVLVICYPEQSISSALTAMGVWAGTFAPALFPFFVVLPALGCEEAKAIYKRLFGRLMDRAFGVPGEAAGAVAVALMAGSPAGAIALSEVKGGMTRAQASRCAILCGGLSPAFLVASVGGALLGSPEIGRRLMAAQLLSILASGWLLRGAWQDDAQRLPGGREGEPGRRAAGTGGPSEEGERGHPVREAVGNVLVVCGWMVLFSVVAGLVAAVLPGARDKVLPLLEVAGGCHAISEMPLEMGVKCLVIAFFCGLGGMCVALQNHAAMPEVPMARLALGKLMHATLSALFAGLLCARPIWAGGESAPVLENALWLAGASVLVVLGLARGERRRPPSKPLPQGGVRAK